MIATKRALIGRTIVEADFRPWRGENGIYHDPVLTLDDGRRIYFVVEETGGAEYGVLIGITNRTAKSKARAKGGS